MWSLRAPRPATIYDDGVLRRDADAHGRRPRGARSRGGTLLASSATRAIRGLPDRSELGSLRKPARRRAYVTLLTNAAYAPGVRALYNSLSEHESEYPLVVMATPAVPASVIADLRSRGCEVRPVPLLPVPTGNGGAARYAAPHFAECWSKLRVWELDEEFELIALVDADMVVVRSFTCVSW